MKILIFFSWKMKFGLSQVTLAYVCSRLLGGLTDPDVLDIEGGHDPESLHDGKWQLALQL